MASPDVGAASASDPDAKDRAALTGLFQTLPMQAHLTLEYRTLLPVVFQIATALQRGDTTTQPEALHRIQVAGRMAGQAIAAPLAALGVAPLPVTEQRFARAFVTGMAHALSLVAPYSTARPRKAKPKAKTQKRR